MSGCRLFGFGLDVNPKSTLNIAGVGGFLIKSIIYSRMEAAVKNEHPGQLIFLHCRWLVTRFSNNHLNIHSFRKMFVENLTTLVKTCRVTVFVK